MNPFEIEFFKAPFLEKGATIESENEQKRTQAYVADLTHLVPRLQRLKVSSVTTRIEHMQERLELRFFLRATMQGDLFSGMHKSRHSPQGDAFEQELQEVHEETERLVPLLEQAMSPGVTPVRLRSEDPLAQQMRIARELMLRRKGMHVLSGHKKPKNYSSALFFPESSDATVSARISNVSPGHAQLRGVAFYGEVPRALENVRFHRSVQMSRPNLIASEEIAMQFYCAMESEALVTMNVGIRWDSVTGQPLDMKFINLL